MRINNDLGGVKDYSKIDRKMKNSNSKKELGSIKEFKKSHVNGKAITYREPDPDNVALFDLKKNAIIKNKLHCRKPSKHGIDVSNYEQANTPSSGFFDLKKPGLSKNLSQRKIGDVNNTDIGNYSTVQTKASHKKYLSKKSTLGDTEITRHYKKKSKVSSRNSYINSAKPSNSQRKNSVSNPKKKPSLKSSHLQKLEPNTSTNGKQVHTARVNLTQASQSPLRYKPASKKTSNLATKYGYLGQNRGDSHHTRVQSHRNSDLIYNLQAKQSLHNRAHSKVSQGGGMIQSTSMKKINSSRSERNSSQLKIKKDIKASQKAKETTHKRKKSKGRDGEIKSKPAYKLQDQILEYLEQYIKYDDYEGDNQESHGERLTILKEFLCYLEEK